VFIPGDHRGEEATVRGALAWRVSPNAMGLLGME